MYHAFYLKAFDNISKKKQKKKQKQKKKEEERKKKPEKVALSITQVSINSFHATGLFLYSLKQKTIDQRFSDVFRG